MALAWTRQSGLSCITPHATRQLERRPDTAAPLPGVKNTNHLHIPKTFSNFETVLGYDKGVPYPAGLGPNRWSGNAGSVLGCSAPQGGWVEWRAAAGAREWTMVPHGFYKDHLTGRPPEKDCRETRSGHRDTQKVWPARREKNPKNPQNKTETWSSLNFLTLNPLYLETWTNQTKHPLQSRRNAHQVAY